MTKEDAITTPIIELAELLVNNVEEFFDYTPEEISFKWDRYDLINELERNDVFEDG